jgi:uroporphyrinogen III methyltransferase/synthase
VITGHEDIFKDRSAVSWDKVSTATDTLICLMGVGTLEKMVERLIRNGRPASTPVAVVQRGTTNRQRTIVGILEDIVDLARQKNVEPPAVIVVGEVVRFRQQLQWFENHPLLGRRILVTRAKRQAGTLSRLLLERGAIPVEMPVIEIKPPATWDELDRAISNVKDYQWVFFTSVNAVEIFLQRLSALGLDISELEDIRIAAIGPATAAALKDGGLHVDYSPQTYTSRDMLAGMRSQDVAGCRTLLPRADIASEELEEGLAGLGAEVHQVTAYRTVLPNKSISTGSRMLAEGEIDVITFTSASTVANLWAILGEEGEVVKRARLACIGPATAAALVARGVSADIIAEKHTIPGLVEAIEQYFLSGGEEGR